MSGCLGSQSAHLGVALFDMAGLVRIALLISLSRGTPHAEELP